MSLTKASLEDLNKKVLRTGNYYSAGKLMLSGEYAVLFGTLSLAIPTKQGQSLIVSSNENIKGLAWSAYDMEGKEWFSVKFNPTLEIEKTSHPEKALFLKTLLKDALGDRMVEGISVKTKLEFSRDWGFGSSSSLVSNIAQMSDIDPLKLFQKSQLGSGYDVAVAFEKKPLIFSLQNGKAEYETVPFNPDFKEHLYFIYLGQKQSSSNEVKRFLEREKPSQADIDALSQITLALLHCRDLAFFQDLMRKHEEITARLIQKESIQKVLFSDFEGQIKSLGAWGGDFILAAGNSDVPKYFMEKEYPEVYRYTELIRNTDNQDL